MSNNETTKPPQVGGSALNVQLCDIKQMISSGFMTVNSGPDGYTVEIKFKSLQQAQELHRVLCTLPDI